MDAAMKDEIAKAVEAAERDQLVQGATRLLGILQKHGFVVKQQIVPDQVGTHPANRDGLGLNSQDIMELIAAICEVGFDDSVPNPLCIEIQAFD